MRKKWTVAELPREVFSGVSADMPLATIAWRAQKRDAAVRVNQMSEAAREIRTLEEALASIAEEAWRLQHFLAGSPQLEAMARRMEETLASVRISVQSPDLVDYAGDLPEMFENIAQRADATVCRPRVVEVIRPAVIRAGGVIRMGKVVVAVPALPSSDESRS